MVGWLVVGWLLVGCAKTPSLSTGDTGPSGGPSGASTTDAGIAGAEQRFAVSGVVLDLNDQPVVDLFVTVSTEYCIPDRTDASGAFSVEDVDAGPLRLITYGDTASNGLFASVVVAFDADQAWTFQDPIWIPQLVDSWPIDLDASEDQVVSTDDGLTLTLPPGSLTLAPFVPAEIQVARVPVDQAPSFIPDGVELIDLFAIHPIQSPLSPPAPVSFPADLGLTVGTPVTFYALDYDTGLLAPVASGTVDDQGHPVTDDGQGIPELTWVGLSLEN